jgi:hypothetical protein
MPRVDVARRVPHRFPAVARTIERFVLWQQTQNPPSERTESGNWKAHRETPAKNSLSLPSEATELSTVLNAGLYATPVRSRLCCAKGVLSGRD